MNNVLKMKLYEVPRESYIRIVDKNIYLPIGSINDVNYDEVLFFDHIDGMYSCVFDKNKNLIHLAASTVVELATEEEFNNQ